MLSAYTRKPLAPEEPYDATNTATKIQPHKKPTVSSVVDPHRTLSHAVVTPQKIASNDAPLHTERKKPRREVKLLPSVLDQQDSATPNPDAQPVNKHRLDTPEEDSDDATKNKTTKGTDVHVTLRNIPDDKGNVRPPVPLHGKKRKVARVDQPSGKGNDMTTATMAVEPTSMLVPSADFSDVVLSSDSITELTVHNEPMGASDENVPIVVIHNKMIYSSDEIQVEFTKNLTELRPRTPIADNGGLVDCLIHNGYIVKTVLDDETSRLAAILFDHHVKTAITSSVMPVIFNNIDIASLHGCGFVPGAQHAMRQHAEYAFCTLIDDITTSIHFTGTPESDFSAQLSLGPFVYQPRREDENSCPYVLARAFYNPFHRNITAFTNNTAREVGIMAIPYRMDMVAELFYTDDAVGIVDGTSDVDVMPLHTDVVRVDPDTYLKRIDQFVTWIKVKAGQVLIYDRDVVRVFAGGMTAGRRSRLFGVHCHVNGKGVPLLLPQNHLERQIIESYVFEMRQWAEYENDHYDEEQTVEFLRRNCRTSEFHGHRYGTYDQPEIIMLTGSACLPSEVPDLDYWDQDDPYPLVWQDNDAVHPSLLFTSLKIGTNDRITRHTFPWLVYQYTYGRLAPGDLRSVQGGAMLTNASKWHVQPQGNNSHTFAGRSFQDMLSLIAGLMETALRTPILANAHRNENTLAHVRKLYTDNEAVRMHTPDLLFLVLHVVYLNQAAADELHKMKTAPILRYTVNDDFDSIFNACLAVFHGRVQSRLTST